MASKIHAYFTPGLLDSVGKGSGKVELKFSKPQDAQDVSIKLFEVDSWTLDGHTVSEGGPDEEVAEIQGVIEQGKFRLTGGSLPFQTTPVNHRLITIDLGADEFKVPLQNIDHEKDFGFFEVTFKITASVAGEQAKYESPTPLFVRNTPTPRAEVAFIGGTPNDFAEPTTKQFFPLASKFWEGLKDNRRNEKSLQAIHSFLRDDSDAAKARRNDLPWGRVNVVSHGNESTWFMRGRESDPEPTGFTSGNLPTADLGTFGSPREEEVDEQTLFIIRGCEIGNDTALLDAIKDKFGGRATVFAPRHEMVYRNEKGILRERLFQIWRVSVPGRSSSITNAKLKAVLKKEYAGHTLYGGFSDADWNKVTAISGTNNKAEEFRQQLITDEKDLMAVSRFEEDDVKNTVGSSKVDKSQAELTTIMRKENDNSTMSDEEFDSFEWTWKVTKDKNPDPSAEPTFTVSGRAVRTEIEIFRLLKTTENGQKVPVTPDLNNPNHFGRSS